MKNLFAPDRRKTYNEIGLIFHRAYFVKGLREEVNLMCNLSEGVEQKGIAKGITASIRNLMESMGWSIEQAMDALQIPTEERNGYLNMLKK